MLLRGCLGRRTGPLRLEVAGSGVREVTVVAIVCGGEGMEEVEELQREEDRSDSLLGATDSSVDQQHRTTFCASKRDARSSHKPAIFMDSGFLVDICFLRGVL